MENKENITKEKGLSNIKNIILVASGKGGVGKSTIASNLALSLSKIGYKSGLLDADIYGPSIPIMFGIEDNIKIKTISNPDKESEIFMLPVEKYNIKLMSIGFLIETSSAMIWRGPMATSALMQMINQVLWGYLDYLIIDLPPGTGDIQLTISQQIPVNGSIIVSTPQDVALADVIRSKSMFDKVNIPVIGIVENMSYFICDNCNKKHNIFKNNKKIETLGMEHLESIPIDKKICETSDNGAPYIFNHSDDLSAKLLNLAKTIDKKIKSLKIKNDINKDLKINNLNVIQ